MLCVSQKSDHPWNAPFILGTYDTSKFVRYDGDWDDDKKHGSGSMKVGTTGETYEGEFRHDFRHGYGVNTWVTGNSYRGDWKMGKKDGYDNIFRKAGGRLSRK